MTNVYDDYRRREQQRQAELVKIKATLLTQLRRAKVAQAVIEYDGEGDSGQIESVLLRDAANEFMANKPLSVRAQATLSQLDIKSETLTGALEDYAWELLSIHHSGFQDNEGAFGTITVDVALGTVLIEHSARSIDVSTTKTEA